MSRIFTIVLSICIFNIHCSQSDSKKKLESKFNPGSFGFDRAFLQQYDSVIILTADSAKSQIIVSPKYQGKVFTSTANGPGGKSFGWINYKAFSATPDPHMNAYGGENRLWIGPEGGPFSLFFNKGKRMQFENWKTPSPIDTEAWIAVKKDARSVQMEKDMVLQNYAGTRF
jgi:hypothetical protein